MDFHDLFDFLEQLQQNNNKEWMDDHRKWYKSLRTEFLHWLDDLDATLLKMGSYLCSLGFDDIRVDVEKVTLSDIVPERDIIPINWK